MSILLYPEFYSIVRKLRMYETLWFYINGSTPSLPSPKFRNGVGFWGVVIAG